MFKNRIAVKLTAGFVVIVLISMLAIGIFFIQMFRQYAFESREKTMLASARSISLVVADYLQSNGTNSPGGNGQMRGFGGYMRSLDTLSECIKRTHISAKTSHLPITTWAVCAITLQVVSNDQRDASRTCQHCFFSAFKGILPKHLDKKYSYSKH